MRRYALAWLCFAFVPLSAQETPAYPQERERQARALAASGQAEQSVLIYDELVRSYPGHAPLRLNYAIALYQAGRYPEVIEQCRAVLARDPKLTRAWLFLGVSLDRIDRSAEALEPLRRAVDAEPEDRNARLALAEALLRTENHEEAAGHFLRSSEQLPSEPRTWFGLAWSCMSAAREASAQLDAAARETAWGHALLGSTLATQQQHGRAIFHYREALRLQPTFPGLHDAIGAIYEASGHPDWAALERLREQTQSPANCSLDPLACAYQTQRYGKILAEQTGGSPAIFFWKAQACGRLAEHAVGKLEALPESYQLHEIRARKFEQAGKYRQATEEWRQALALSPSPPHLRVGLASALFHAGDFAAVIDLLEPALEDPSMPLALRYMRGVSLLRTERPAEAATALEKVVAAQPDYLAAHAGLSEAYLQLGRPAEALPHIQASLPLDENGEYHFRLSRAYRLLGRSEEARQAIEDYQRLHDEAEARRQELEEPVEITPP